MKQILQNLKSGELMIEDVPAPGVKSGHLLIQTHCTLISAGTERMLVDFGRANLLDKARQQPEKVKQVLRKIKTDGLMPTIDAVRAKLDQPMPLGYSNVGHVIAVGKDVDGFSVGDRVVSNGPHAEVVVVPKNLCAKIPDGVSDEDASFTVVGAIGLQGIRLLAPSLGDSVAVFGLGLIGLISVQMLAASGARVLGFDYDAERVKMAQDMGIEAVDLSTGADPIKLGLGFSDGHGVDGVLVTASTKSNDLMHQAAQMSRKRGKIVLTGVTGLQLDRNDFYEKEISFQVSCSYGPGRYDSAYEDNGQDYPIGFVRWTQNRNFMATLDLMRADRIKVNHMISMRKAVDQAKEAYDAVAAKQGLGILLEYPYDKVAVPNNTRTVTIGGPVSGAGKAVLGVVGAGNFTQRSVLGPLKDAGARLKWIASGKGVTGTTAAKKHGIEQSTTDIGEILADNEVTGVVITTRHNAHASMVLRALEAGKHVFVEKPLCMDLEELAAIEKAKAASGKMVMVGFNRRFSPLMQSIAKKTSSRANPLSMTYLCNAGAIPGDHWTQDKEVGGGRIIGEACHFIDLFQFLADSPIISVSAFKQNLRGEDLEDVVSINLIAEDGSIGNINYFANGSNAFPKERCDVFYDGNVLTMDNFKSAKGYGTKLSQSVRRQDKGHRAGFAAFVNALEAGGEPPISFDALGNVTRATIAAVISMREGRVVQVGDLS